MLRAYRILKNLQFWLLIGLFTLLGLAPNPGAGFASANDLALHFCGYVAAGISVSLARPNSAPWLRFLALFSYSLAIEVGQYFVPERSFDVRDLLANGAGIATGLALYQFAVAHLDRKIEQLLHPIR
ncbi:VanZ family protein [Simiduia aestuariiviva]|uniref:VanZ family protein n=1 Tax=Simiduia aestuariiviva TaxID=1510459 RepID=A0A839UND3_9GAMM|nr:VanZ family protein [Simiduia aestuariiviva]MBB3167256.1 VanZ family protein [Simiduia aestuariiviva]